METLIGLLPLIAMLGLFYLIVFIPENRRKKKYNAMLSALSVNDEIITKGGILGKIVNLQDDFVIIQTGPDRARIKLSKNGISSVLNSSNAEESK
jgi:preprotein translocase subunit YajC